MVGALVARKVLILACSVAVLVMGSPLETDWTNEGTKPDTEVNDKSSGPYLGRPCCRALSWACSCLRFCRLAVVMVVGNWKLVTLRSVAVSWVR